MSVHALAPLQPVPARAIDSPFQRRLPDPGEHPLGFAPITSKRIGGFPGREQEPNEAWGNRTTRLQIIADMMVDSQVKTILRKIGVTHSTSPVAILAPPGSNLRHARLALDSFVQSHPNGPGQRRWEREQWMQTTSDWMHGYGWALADSVWHREPDHWIAHKWTKSYYPWRTRDWKFGEGDVPVLVDIDYYDAKNMLRTMAAIPVAQLTHFWRGNFEPEGESSLRPLWAPWRMKAKCRQLLGILLERYAIGVPVAKMRSEILTQSAAANGGVPFYDPSEAKQLRAALEQYMGHETAAMVLPGSWDVDIKEVDVSGADILRRVMSQSDDEMARLLGLQYMNYGGITETTPRQITRELIEDFFRGLMSEKKYWRNKMMEVLDKMAAYNLGEDNLRKGGILDILEDTAQTAREMGDLLIAALNTPIGPALDLDEELKEFIKERVGMRNRAAEVQLVGEWGTPAVVETDDVPTDIPAPNEVAIQSFLRDQPAHPNRVGYGPIAGFAVPRLKPAQSSSEPRPGRPSTEYDEMARLSDGALAAAARKRSELADGFVAALIQAGASRWDRVHVDRAPLVEALTDWGGRAVLRGGLRAHEKFRLALRRMRTGIRYAGAAPADRVPEFVRTPTGLRAHAERLIDNAARKVAFDLELVGHEAARELFTGPKISDDQRSELESRIRFHLRGRMRGEMEALMHDLYGAGSAAAMARIVDGLRRVGRGESVDGQKLAAARDRSWWASWLLSSESNVVATVSVASSVLSAFAGLTLWEPRTVLRFTTNSNKPCLQCERADGTLVDYGSEEYTRLLPPYSQCEGGDFCKCTFEVEVQAVPLAA